MTAVEVVLILIGLVFMIGSFMVTEKLSPDDMEKIAKMSETEINAVVEKKMANASERIENQIEDAVDHSLEKVERSLEKETNEKIMAISEYSDTVVENMNKTHNEIMFLYSMLNDKHEQLTELSTEISRMAAKVEEDLVQEEQKETEPVSEVAAETVTAAEAAPEEETEPEEEQLNHNERILLLYKEGKSCVEIAKELGLGQGEVKLVLDLYKGDE